MKRIVVCFPPRQKKSSHLYFRAQQLIDNFQKEFKLDIIYPLAKSGSSKETKINLRKIIRFLLLFPKVFKKIKNADIMLIFSSSLFYFWIIIGKLLKKKIILDHFTTPLSPMGNSPKPKFFKKIFGVLDQFFYQKIDLVLTHSHTIKMEISQFYNFDIKKIVVIYSVVDTSLFNPQKIKKLEIKKLKKSLGLPLKKPILFYHGEGHPFHGLPIITQIASLCQKQKKEYLFVFLGGGTSSCQNCYHLSYVPFKKLPSFLALADLWLGRFSNHPIAQRVLSSCMLQAMAMAKPVITYTSQENKKVIKDKKNGFLVNTLNSQKILAKIEKIIKDKSLMEKVGKNARQTIIKYYSLKEWQKVVQAVKKL